jgi:adenine-specific DNA methylase
MKHESTKINFETGEITEVNANFVQVYVDKIDFITNLIIDNPRATAVFMFLIKHMDKRNAIIISQQAISEAMGISRKTVYSSIKYLIDKKALTIYKSGTSNIYAVNSQIAWKATANGKRYALFDARVYISKSEQDPIFSSEVVSIVRKKGTK